MRVVLVPDYPRAPVKDDFDLGNVSVPFISELVRTKAERQTVRLHLIHTLVNGLMNVREILVHAPAMALREFTERPDPDRLVEDFEINPREDIALQTVFSIWETLRSALALHATNIKQGRKDQAEVLRTIDKGVSDLVSLAA